MKVERKFIYVNKQGDCGWLIHDRPNFDPSPGWRPHLLCHDIFEHHNDDAETLEAELMALGATYFIRVQGGWSRFIHHDRGERGHYVQYQDITYFLRLANNKVESCDTEIHPELRYYADLAMRDGNRDGFRVPDIETCYKWVSKGFQRAKERFTGNDATEVLNKLWEPVWRYFGGRKNANEENPCDLLWRVVDNTMTVTFDTVTLEWDVSYQGKRVGEDMAALDAILLGQLVAA